MAGRSVGLLRGRALCLRSPSAGGGMGARAKARGSARGPTSTTARIPSNSCKSAAESSDSSPCCTFYGETRTRIMGRQSIAPRPTSPPFSASSFALYLRDPHQASLALNPRPSRTQPRAAAREHLDNTTRRAALCVLVPPRRRSSKRRPRHRARPRRPAPRESPDRRLVLCLPLPFAGAGAGAMSERRPRHGH